MSHCLIAGLAACMFATPARAQSTARTPAPSAPKPSIILVHGAWADGSSWDRVIPLLEAKGYHVVAVHLPMSSVADDVAATERAIDREPGDVVLAGHAYGGVVISLAGNTDKVKSLVFVNAFGLDEGESIRGLSKDSPPPWQKTLDVDGNGYSWMPLETVRTDFAQDLPAAMQKMIAAKQAPTSLLIFDYPVHSPAWKDKPNWYVRGTQDHIIDPAMQEMMAKRMNAKLTSVNAGHVSMLSKPREVAAAIIQAASAEATQAQAQK